MHADARTGPHMLGVGAVRHSQLTSPSVERSVKELNATAGWDWCRRPRAVTPRDLLATQSPRVAQPAPAPVNPSRSDSGDVTLQTHLTASRMGMQLPPAEHRARRRRRPADIAAPISHEWSSALRKQMAQKLPSPSGRHLRKCPTRPGSALLCAAPLAKPSLLQPIPVQQPYSPPSR